VLSRFYFLLGNILRSAEFDVDAVNCYRKAMENINKSDCTIRNSELQKIHITYGIAESYLKTQQFDRAIEVVDDFLQTNSTTAKFGIALIHLLKARAYLSKGVKFCDEARKWQSSASLLFNEIQLPYYIERCNLVLAAIEIRNGKLSKGRKLLENIIGDNDHVSSLVLRARILKRYASKEEKICDTEEIQQIVDQRGFAIGSFFAQLANIEIEMPRIEFASFGLAGDKIHFLSVKKPLTKTNKKTWIVD